MKFLIDKEINKENVVKEKESIIENMKREFNKEMAVLKKEKKLVKDLALAKEDVESKKADLKTLLGEKNDIQKENKKLRLT